MDSIKWLTDTNSQTGREEIANLVHNTAPCHLPEDYHGNAFLSVNQPSCTHQLLIEIFQLQVSSTVCINRTSVFVLSPKDDSLTV